MRWILLWVGLSCGAAYAQHEQHGKLQNDAPMRDGGTVAAFASAMDAGMAAMMRGMHAPGYSGNADVDFLAMMIPHHAGAVEMARLMLIHGRDPLTRQLAQEIIASQVVEIEGMQRRLAILRAGALPARDDFPALGGTRGPAR